MAHIITPNQARKLYNANQGKGFSSPANHFFRRMLVEEVARAYRIPVTQRQLNQIALELTNNRAFFDQRRCLEGFPVGLSQDFEGKLLSTTIKDAVLNSKTIKGFFELMRERRKAAERFANEVENYIARQLGLL